MYLNEATLLNNIRVRYSKDKIYVSTDTRRSGRSVKYCETETVVRSSSSSPCCIHSWTQWCVKCTGHTWGSVFRWTCGAENERINKRSRKQKEKLIKVRGSVPLIVKSQNFTLNQKNSELGKTTSRCHHPMKEISCRVSTKRRSWPARTTCGRTARSLMFPHSTEAEIYSTLAWNKGITYSYCTNVCTPSS